MLWLLVVQVVYYLDVKGQIQVCIMPASFDYPLGVIGFILHRLNSRARKLHGRVVEFDLGPGVHVVNPRAESRNLSDSSYLNRRLVLVTPLIRRL